MAKLAASETASFVTQVSQDIDFLLEKQLFVIYAKFYFLMSLIFNIFNLIFNISLCIFVFIIKKLDLIYMNLPSKPSINVISGIKRRVVKNLIIDENFGYMLPSRVMQHQLTEKH